MSNSGLKGLIISFLVEKAASDNYVKLYIMVMGFESVPFNS